MGFLRITSDHIDGMFEIGDEPLKVGRSRDNPIRLPHKSVSRHHATVSETGDGLVIKDLASSFGTFVNEDKLTHGVAHPGDVIRFGRIRLVYEVEKQDAGRTPGKQADPAYSEARREPGKDAASATDGGRPCEKHPANLLSFVCPKCRLRFCDSCVNRLEVAGVEKPHCPYCKDACKPLGFFQIEEDRRKARESRTFFQALPSVFAHPFSATGVPLLLIGTLLYLGLSYAADYSPFLLILPVFYLMAFVHKIMASTAAGTEDLPAWPNLAEAWNDVIRPGLLLSASSAIAFAPLLAYAYWTVKASEPLSPTALFPLTVWGLLYLPFSVLATGTKDGFDGLNPITVLSAFGRLHLQFMFSAVFWLFLIAGRFVLENVFAAFIRVPALPTLMTGFVSVTILLVAMRLFGTLYHTNRSKLHWHSED